jgi:hypothetical protein
MHVGHSTNPKYSMPQIDLTRMIMKHWFAGEILFSAGAGLCFSSKFHTSRALPKYILWPACES